MTMTLLDQAYDLENIDFDNPIPDYQEAAATHYSLAKEAVEMGVVDLDDEGDPVDQLAEVKDWMIENEYLPKPGGLPMPDPELVLSRYPEVAEAYCGEFDVDLKECGAYEYLSYVEE